MKIPCYVTLVAILVALAPYRVSAQEASLTPKAIQAELNKNLSDADSAKLAEDVAAAVAAVITTLTCTTGSVVKVDGGRTLG